MSFPDSSTTNSYSFIYQTRRYGVIGEEQYKKTIQQNHTSFLYKYWTAR